MIKAVFLPVPINFDWGIVVVGRRAKEICFFEEIHTTFLTKFSERFPFGFTVTVVHNFSLTQVFIKWIQHSMTPANVTVYHSLQCMPCKELIHLQCGLAWLTSTFRGSWQKEGNGSILQWSFMHIICLACFCCFSFAACSSLSAQSQWGHTRSTYQCKRELSLLYKKNFFSWLMCCWSCRSIITHLGGPVVYVNPGSWGLFTYSHQDQNCSQRWSEP